MTAASDIDAREAFVERLIADVTAALEAMTVYLGIRLGLYGVLAESGPLAYVELAERAGIAARYAREWLEQQAAAGYLECDSPELDADERRFRIPPGIPEVFTDPRSPYNVTGAVLSLGSVAHVLPELCRAYRSGGGVPYADFGEEMRRGIGDLNRPMFEHELRGWLESMPDVERRLRSAPAAQVLDIGCGRGASAISLARVFPRISVLGVDLDASSVEEACRAAADAGLAHRVSFAVADAAHLAETGRFDLVTAFETLHDMGDPVAALATAHRLLNPGGVVLAADERVADHFTAPADPVERCMYGWSVLHCLPATIAEKPVVANGTVLRAPTVRQWAQAAGFTDCQILPIDNPFWRFYRLQKAG
jgi:ubiquinone/menaquinone biosynthesis C-methylase UbiE